MTPDKTEIDIRAQVIDIARAFLKAVGKSAASWSAADPMRVEIRFEGAWPVYIDGAAMLRELACGSTLTCHSIWNSAPDPSAAPAVVFKLIGDREGGNVRHFAFVDVPDHLPKAAAPLVTSAQLQTSH